jgi:hypothetical protein
MEAWEITVNPKDGSLGLEGLRRREFTEYQASTSPNTSSHRRLAPGRPLNDSFSPLYLH